MVQDRWPCEIFSHYHWRGDALPPTGIGTNHRGNSVSALPAGLFFVFLVVPLSFCLLPPASAPGGSRSGQQRQEEAAIADEQEEQDNMPVGGRVVAQMLVLQSEYCGRSASIPLWETLGASVTARLITHHFLSPYFPLVPLVPLHRSQLGVRKEGKKARRRNHPWHLLSQPHAWPTNY